MKLKKTLRPLLCSAFVIAGLATLPGQAFAAGINLVQNGGFETGDLGSWTQVGNTGFGGVFCGGAPEGSCEAFFGPLGSPGGITQSVATTPGGRYSISFVFTSDGGAPASFEADFGGQTLLSLTNPPAAGDQTFNFTGFATSAATLLQFQFRDDPGFLFLDAVQVTAVPEPASLALVGAGLLGLTIGRRRKVR